MIGMGCYFLADLRLLWLLGTGWYLVSGIIYSEFSGL